MNENIHDHPETDPYSPQPQRTGSRSGAGKHSCHRHAHSKRAARRSWKRAPAAIVAGGGVGALAIGAVLGGAFSPVGVSVPSAEPAGASHPASGPKAPGQGVLHLEDAANVADITSVLGAFKSSAIHPVPSHTQTSHSTSSPTQGKGSSSTSSGASQTTTAGTAPSSGTSAQPPSGGSTHSNGGTTSSGGGTTTAGAAQGTTPSASSGTKTGEPTKSSTSKLPSVKLTSGGVSVTIPNPVGGGSNSSGGSVSISTPIAGVSVGSGGINLSLGTGTSGQSSSSQSSATSTSPSGSTEATTTPSAGGSSSTSTSSGGSGEGLLGSVSSILGGS